MNPRHVGWVLDIIVVCSLLPRVVHADPASAGDFRTQRGVVVTRAGPQRLTVDLDLLACARPSLEDVRLFDKVDHEIPYLLVLPPTGDPTWENADLVQPTVQGKEQSGFEADLGRVLRIDRLRMVGLQAPFLKRLRLEASGDRRRYVTLANEQTLFDLPEQGLRRTEVDFAPGDYRYLRVIWDDHATSKVGLPDRVSARSAGGIEPAVPLCANVPFEPRPSRPEVSQWRIRLPSKQLPIAALQIETSQPQLMRPGRVSESRLIGNRLESTLLGAATLRRALRSGLVAADLRIPIVRSETNELILAVDNGNNPPFELKQLCVELQPQPFIYFEANQTGSLTLRCGSAKAASPRYDLEVERENVIGRALATAEWAGPGQPLVQAPAVVAPNPPNDALLHGSPLEPERFSYSSRIITAARGMTSLRLDTAVLAHSADLSDLRILDEQHRQIPYLLEHESEPWVVDLRLVPLSKDQKPDAFDARHSAYRVELPFSNLPPGRLSIGTDARVFRRNVSLFVERVRGKRRLPEMVPIAQTTWVHADPNQAAPILELAIPTIAEQKLFLVVEDGDNVALPIGTCRLLLAAKTLRFFHANGESLTLYYGDTTLSPPDYDLALLTKELEQLTTTEADLDQERIRPSQPTHAERLSKWFWAVLVATVAILLLLIVRLVGKGDKGQT
jgi:hypothetical protein